MGGVTLETPAPYLEARALLARLAGTKPGLGHAAAYQLALSHTVAIRQGDALLGLLCFFPDGPGVEECALACRPRAELGPSFVPLQRAGRLTIRARLHHAGVDVMVAHTQRGDATAARLARLAGFLPAASTGGPHGFERWEMRV